MFPRNFQYQHFRPCFIEISTVNMDGYDSNRHAFRSFGVLSNATNSLGLPIIDRRHTPVPLSRALEVFQVRSTLFTGIAGLKQTHKRTAWDLKVTGAPLTIESISLEKAKSGGSLRMQSTRNGTVKRKTSETQWRSRRVSLASQSSGKTTVTSEGEEGKGRMIRSLSLERVPGQRRKAVCAASCMAVKQMISRNEGRKGPGTVRRHPIGSAKDSPTRVYARMLQRTSEQIERENLQGWE